MENSIEVLRSERLSDTEIKHFKKNVMFMTLHEECFNHKTFTKHNYHTKWTSEPSLGDCFFESYNDEHQLPGYVVGIKEERVPHKNRDGSVSQMIRKDRIITYTCILPVYDDFRKKWDVKETEIKTIWDATSSRKRCIADFYLAQINMDDVEDVYNGYTESIERECAMNAIYADRVKKREADRKSAKMELTIGNWETLMEKIDSMQNEINELKSELSNIRNNKG